MFSYRYISLSHQLFSVHYLCHHLISVYYFTIVQLDVGFPDGTIGKEHLPMQKTRHMSSIPGLGRFSWRRAWQSKYSCLKNPHGQRSLAGGLQSIGSQRVKMTEATQPTCTQLEAEDIGWLFGKLKKKKKWRSKCQNDFIIQKLYKIFNIWPISFIWLPLHAMLEFM